jgi:hypothetical protein
VRAGQTVDEQSLPPPRGQGSVARRGLSIMFGLPAIRAAVLAIVLSRRSIGSGALQIRVRTLFTRLGSVVPLVRVVVARLSILIARFGRTVSLPSDPALVKGGRLVGVITCLNHFAIMAELTVAIGLSGPPGG